MTAANDDCELVLYQAPDGRAKLQVRLDGGTLWLTQQQLAELYQSTPQNITRHIRAIYGDGEVDEAATCKPYLRVGAEQRLEDYVVHALIDKDDIDYNTQASLLYDLAGQMVAHLRGYLADEGEVRDVLMQERKTLADNIYAQMHAHFRPTATDYTVDVRRGFTALKAPTFSVGAGQTLRNYRLTVDEPSRIKQMVFGHFSKCLFPMQKFDSDTERRFAVILERDAQKWFKPAKGQFQIFYKLGVEQPEYVPDFVVETAHALLMCETKARNELTTPEVVAKAEAGVLWCQRASGLSGSGKPWKYMLIPHDQVTEEQALGDFLQFEPR